MAEPKQQSWKNWFLSLDGLIVLISGLAIASYYGGIVLLGCKKWWWPGLNDVAASVISGVITTIGATLATHTGAVVALARVQATNKAAGKEVSQKQIAAAMSYVFSQFVALILWGVNGFDATDSLGVVKNLALGLPGVAGGILAVALNVTLPPGTEPPPNNENTNVIAQQTGTITIPETKKNGE